MNELVVRSNSVVTTYDEVERAAKAMAASGFFTDTKSISQAIVKIMAGQELGFGPFASMNGVYIIQGRPSFGANMMAAAVKASGRYNYRVIEMSDHRCEIAFFEQGQECGRSTFTLDDAKKAGTKNLDKFPRNMLFARAMSNGVRWYCPDVTNGSAVYTPEELGAEVDGDGNVVILPEEKVTEIEYVMPVTETESAKERATILKELGFDADPPQPLPLPKLATSDKLRPYADMKLETASEVVNSKGFKYGDLPTKTLSHMHNTIVRSLLNSDTSAEDKETLYYKRDACKVLLEARAQA